MFYSKAMKTFGKWKTNSEMLAEGSVVYIEGVEEQAEG